MNALYDSDQDLALLLRPPFPHGTRLAHSPPSTRCQWEVRIRLDSDRLRLKLEAIPHLPFTNLHSPRQSESNPVAPGQSPPTPPAESRTPSQAAAGLMAEQLVRERRQKLPPNVRLADTLRKDLALALEHKKMQQKNEALQQSPSNLLPQPQTAAQAVPPTPAPPRPRRDFEDPITDDERQEIIEKVTEIVGVTLPSERKVRHKRHLNPEEHAALVAKIDQCFGIPPGAQRLWFGADGVHYEPPEYDPTQWHPPLPDELNGPQKPACSAPPTPQPGGPPTPEPSAPPRPAPPGLSQEEVGGIITEAERQALAAAMAMDMNLHDVRVDVVTQDGRSTGDAKDQSSSPPAQSPDDRWPW